MPEPTTPIPPSTDITFFGTRVYFDANKSTLADIAATSGYTVAEIITANAPRLNGVLPDEPLFATDVVNLPGNPKIQIQLPSGSYTSGSAAVAPKVNNVVPEPYIIRTEEDLLRWMWTHEWHNNPKNYNESEAKAQFRDYVIHVVERTQAEIAQQLIPYQPASGSRETDRQFSQLMDYGVDPSRSEDMAALLNSLTNEQLLALQHEMQKVDLGGGDPFLVDAKDYLNYYDATQTLQNGGKLPYDPYATYDPELALHDFFDRSFKSRNPDDVEKYLVNMAVNLIIGTNEGWDATEEHDQDDVRKILYEMLGTTEPKIEDLISFIEDTVQSQIPPKAEDSDWSDEELLTGSNNPDLVNDYRIAEQYHEAQALDGLRKIAYDPLWNPVEEKNLLQKLNTAIGQMPRSIIGVDIGFVQDGFQQFHRQAKDLHDWRMNLKASMDRIEAEMLDRRDEQPSFWWLAEIGLSLLFPELNALFLFRNVINSISEISEGDSSGWGSLFINLAFSLGEISRAGRYLTGASDEITTMVQGIDEFMPQMDELEEVLSKKPVENGFSPTGFPEYDDVLVDPTDPNFRKKLKDPEILYKTDLTDFPILKDLVDRMDKLNNVRFSNGFKGLRAAETIAKVDIPQMLDGTIRIIYDPSITRIVDYLHEETHVLQTEKLLAGGYAYQTLKRLEIEQPQRFNLFFDYLEKEAYENEIARALELGFSNAYIADVNRGLARYWDENKQILLDNILGNSPDDVFAKMIKVLQGD